MPDVIGRVVHPSGAVGLDLRTRFRLVDSAGNRVRQAWDTAKPNRDPSASAPALLIQGLADDIRVWYSTNDPTVLPADITTFVALTGVRAIPLGAIGHDQNTLTAAVHAQAQAAWIWSRF